MTNIQSIAGGVVWTIIAGVLMLAALEPVRFDDRSFASASAVAAEAPSAHAAA